MRRNSWLFGLLALSMLVWSPYEAAADPWKDESGNGKYEREYNYKKERKRDRHGYKYEWQDGNCKYKYKKGKHGYKEERKCKGGAHYTGGPPPWAPAHGYRAHQRGAQTAYVPPFDLNRGRCNRELLGRLLGAAAGGLAGSRIGDGRGQLATTAGGTLLGFLIGGTIGRNMELCRSGARTRPGRPTDCLEQLTDGRPVPGRADPDPKATYGR